VELIPSLVQGVTDVDTIAQRFFVLKWAKDKSGGRIFQSREITVYLMGSTSKCLSTLKTLPMLLRLVFHFDD
jgi:hypothetical protein